MERINFRDGTVGNVKKHAVPSVSRYSRFHLIIKLKATNVLRIN